MKGALVNRALALCLGVLMGVNLMGCSTAPAPLGKPLPNLTYTHLSAYQPYGGAVLVRQSAALSDDTNKTMNGMVKRLDNLLQSYATGRFLTATKAPDRQVKSVFDITNLRFTKKADAQNMVGILSGAASEYYTLNLAIALYPVLHDGTLWEPYTIKINRELLIPDNISLAEREFCQFEFLEKVINDIDKTINEFIPTMQ